MGTQSYGSTLAVKKMMLPGQYFETSGNREMEVPFHELRMQIPENARSVALNVVHAGHKERGETTETVINWVPSGAGEIRFEMSQTVSFPKARTMVWLHGNLIKPVHQENNFDNYYYRFEHHLDKTWAGQDLEFRAIAWNLWAKMDEFVLHAVVEWD